MMNRIQTPFRYSRNAVAIAMVLASNLSYATFSASVDRTTLADYETLTLTLRTDQTDTGSPDLTPLETDFNVLGTRQYQKHSSINGRSSFSRDWIITLMPKQAGSFDIPALSLGDEKSSPIAIKVEQEAEAAQTAQKDSAKAPRNIFITTKLSRDNVYVQQELLFTIQILFRIPLYDESSLTPMNLENALVQQLGKGTSHEKVIDGVRYQVFELEYSIHPQQAGTLTIPALTFNGNTSTNNQSADPFDSFFSNRYSMQPVVAKSQPLNILVKEKPLDYPLHNTWLPSRQLMLTEHWSHDINKLKMGDAITRTVTVRADGLTAAQIPPIEMGESPKGVNSYPDKTNTSNETSDKGVLGTRTDAIAMILTQAGKIELPAIEYTWFNVNTNKTEVAVLPALSLNVAATDATALNEKAQPDTAEAAKAATNSASTTAEAATAPTATATPESTKPETVEKEVVTEVAAETPVAAAVKPASDTAASTKAAQTALATAQPTPSAMACPEPAPGPQPEPCPTVTADSHKASSTLWPWLTAIFAALWFATMISWNIQRTRSYNAEHGESDTASPKLDDTAEKAAFSTLEKACQNNQASQVLQILPQWVACFLHEQIQLSLATSLERLGSEELSQQTQMLSNQLYGSGQKAAQTDKVLQAILEEVRRIRMGRSQQDDNDLKPMYPA